MSLTVSKCSIRRITTLIFALEQKTLRPWEDQLPHLQDWYYSLQHRERVEGHVSVSPVAEVIYSHCHKDVMWGKWGLTQVCDSFDAANLSNFSRHIRRHGVFLLLPRLHNTNTHMHRWQHVDSYLEIMWWVSRLLGYLLMITSYTSIDREPFHCNLNRQKFQHCQACSNGLTLPWGCWEM